MFWSFAFSTVIALILYTALQRRFDSIMAQLRNDLLAGIEELKQGQETVTIQREQPKDKHDALIRKRVYLDFSRYAVQDAYTISELTRSYDREDSRGRIRLLRCVYAQTTRLPYELALKAVTDSDPAVREWMARKAQDLDYREARHESADALLKTTHPDRNLTERLRQDSDPFVRATLFENSKLFNFLWHSERWLDEFKRCAPLERLAMMRNEELNLDLVKLILDPDDTELGLEMSERFLIARASLINAHVVQNGRRRRANDFADGYGWYQAGKHSQAVWELAAKWPEDSGIQFLAFKSVQTDDKVKAGIYPKCKAVPLREAILESCLQEDLETIRLGRSDTDASARFIAYHRSRRMDRQEIEDALRRERSGKEKWVIDGLLENPWLGLIARELLNAMPETEGTHAESDSSVPNIAD
jgi:hypothetical protein